MQQHATFIGSVPEKYDRYMGPIFFEPYAEDLVGRLHTFSGMRVLELACGTGIVTRLLRDALPPDAKLLATDLNDAMINQARSKFERDGGVEWRQADAMALPFAAQSFDAAICQFGVMFFPDKLAGFREAYRVLDAGGVFLFSVWDAIEKNQLSFVAAQAVGRFFSVDPPDFYRVPFGFHDRDQITAQLAAVGFSNVEITSVRKRGEAESANDAAIALVEGTPMIGQLLARSEVRASEVVNAVAIAIGERFGDKPVQSTLTALVCTAQKPQRE
jgi:ubiquinone/menaquinone biosynthesis C-methylase UbiE